MRLERGMEGGREKSEKDDSEARAKLCLAARSRKAKARLQRPGDGGKAQSASEERSHASVPEHSGGRAALWLVVRRRGVLYAAEGSPGCEPVYSVPLPPPPTSNGVKGALHDYSRGT